MSFPFGQLIAVTPRSKTGVDALGIDTYLNGPSTVVRGAFAPQGTSELVQGQDQVTTQPVVYLPRGTTVGPLDLVTVNGTVYEVDGTPADWDSPFTGWHPGLEVKLKAVTG